MRIEKTSQSLPFIASGSEMAETKNMANPYASKNTSKKGYLDILDISELGKRLRVSSGSSAKVSKTDALISKDPVLQLMNRSLDNTEKILEQMKAMAESALGENLSDVKRLEMQIEMEDLRRKLYNSTNAMSEEFAQMSGQDMTNRSVQIFESATDSKSLLARARNRAARGEEWNVAEKYVVVEELAGVKVTDNNGEKWIEAEEWFNLRDDTTSEKNVISVFDKVDSTWRVASDRERFNENIPTVLERMEASATIILTDTKSAADGINRLDKELDGMRQMRSEFTDFVKKDAQRSLNESMSSANVGVKTMSMMSSKMSKEDTNMLLWQIAQKEQSTKQENDGSFRAYAGGADVNAGAKKTESSAGASVKENENRFFSTPLGIMEYTSKCGTRNPRLTRPTTPKGEMFSKIEKFFDKVAGKFAGNINEGIFGKIDTVGKEI